MGTLLNAARFILLRLRYSFAATFGAYEWIIRDSGYPPTQKTERQIKKAGAMATYSADLIADYFRALANPEFGDVLSNLKLQKLCYYAAGLMAAVRQNDDDPLFAEPIEAWQHGPVVPAQYRRFKEYGAGDIPPVSDLDIDQIARNDRLVLDDVYNYYGQYSAWKLRNMTHEEAPWITAFARDDKRIYINELRDFFSTEVSQEYIASYYEAGQGQ